MLSPSSGSCLAGLIKILIYISHFTVIIRSDLSVCHVILGKIKKKPTRRGPIMHIFHFAHFSFSFWHILFGYLWGKKWRRMSWRYEGWELEDGGSRLLCLPTIITRLLPACCSWKPFHFWLCIKCILCHTRANLQLLCVVNYQIIINSNIQTTATSLHVQNRCPQLNTCVVDHWHWHCYDIGFRNKECVEGQKIHVKLHKCVCIFYVFLLLRLGKIESDQAWIISHYVISNWNMIDD